MKAHRPPRAINTIPLTITSVLLTALFSMFFLPAEAVVSGTFTVSGTATDDCSAPSQTDQKSGINFAPFDPIKPVTVQATASFSIKCSNGTAIQVYLGGSSGTDRTMTGVKNSNHKLFYQIYKSDYTTPWPTSSASAITVGTSTGKANAVTWTLYGQLDNGANADAAVDSYGVSGDAVTLNVVY